MIRLGFFVSVCLWVADLLGYISVTGWQIVTPFFVGLGFWVILALIVTAIAVWAE